MPSHDKSSPLDGAINPLLRGFEGFGGKKGALGGIAIFQALTLVILAWVAWRVHKLSKK